MIYKLSPRGLIVKWITKNNFRSKKMHAEMK